MKLDEIKEKLVLANKTYRTGKPIMTDFEFDALLEEYQKMISEEEYSSFRNSLHEVSGKVKHPFVMGSLDKLTVDKPENIKTFIGRYVTTKLNISAKVDGISCRLHYENGELKSASTRGDGEFGENLTDKIQFVQRIPKKISTSEIIDLRGELVILKDDFASMTGFANPRNATAGIMGRKDINEKDLSKITFVAYTILGPKFSKREQFDLLEKEGFYVAWNVDKNLEEANSDGFVDTLTSLASQNFQYGTDGLVICDCTYHNEDKYRPDACEAVKINENFAVTRILDVEWRGPSAGGKFVPVAQLDPVELCGTTVSQATMNNLDFIEKMGLKYGSVVKVQKRGEIIPAIVEVISNSDSSEIEIPSVCPCCGSELVKEGPFMWCKNKSCGDQTIKQLALFIRKLGVKHSSEASLRNFKIFSFDDLLAFAPSQKYKSEMTLASELKEKVFTRSKKDLLAAMNFKDLSEVLIGKIVDFYGFENIIAGKYEGLPEGIGDITLQKFKDDIQENLKIVDKFTHDSRYSYSGIDPAKSGIKDKKTGISVCFTGALSISRGKASELAKSAGFEVKGGVSKGLTYLVTNDPSSGSSKNKKAAQLGTKIIDESQFMKLVDSHEVESSIDNL